MMITVFVVTLIFIAITLLLIRYFLAHDRGPREPIGALWIAAGFGVLAFVAAYLLEMLIPNPAVAVIHHQIFKSFYLYLSVGFIEEFFKFVPLAFFIYKRKYFEEHNDGIIYFVIAGLVLGLIENILYNYAQGPLTGTVRIFLTPMFHGGLTAMVGYFLAKKKVEHKSWLTVFAAFFGAVLIHGLYDFGFGSGLWLMSIMLTILVTVGLFLFYHRANELDRKQGISAHGFNSFCEECGRANINHTLFCEYCGKKF